MTILVFADHDGKNLSDHTARAISAALQIGQDIDIVVSGKNIVDIAKTAAKLKGIRKVITVEADSLEHQLAEPTASLLLSLSSGYEYIMAPATASSKNIMPRVAALLDVMQISEIISVEAPDTFKRAIYAGNAIQLVQTHEAKKIITVRTASFEAAQYNDQMAEIITVSVALSMDDVSEFIENQLSSNDRPELGSAKIIISGGRALGSEENFRNVILPLADKLGAAVGASRAAVDAGYAPNDWQVGQTGKIVAPDLYIACGISGAIQHLAGMKDSKIIVAINKDSDAPIFQIADYGLVGDLFEVLPEFLSQLNA